MYPNCLNSVIVLLQSQQPPFPSEIDSFEIHTLAFDPQFYDLFRERENKKEEDSEA